MDLGTSIFFLSLANVEGKMGMDTNYLTFQIKTKQNKKSTTKSYTICHSIFPNYAEKPQAPFQQRPPHSNHQVRELKIVEPILTCNNPENLNKKGKKKKKILACSSAYGLRHVGGHLNIKRTFFFCFHYEPYLI